MHAKKEEIRALLLKKQLEAKTNKERGMEYEEEDDPMLFCRNKDGAVRWRGSGKDAAVIIDLQRLMVDPNSFSAVRSTRASRTCAAAG